MARITRKYGHARNDFVAPLASFLLYVPLACRLVPRVNPPFRLIRLFWRSARTRALSGETVEGPISTG